MLFVLNVIAYQWQEIHFLCILNSSLAIVINLVMNAVHLFLNNNASEHTIGK